MSIFTCDEVHWRLVELNIDHACGLASLVKIIGGRLGIFNIPNIIDVMVYNSYETVNHALGGSVVVERSLVPGATLARNTHREYSLCVH
ncbi:hypothetical protein [Vulcanisaeta souniana]|uniref:hypothetical protein n=1 Tax=Vulcanisaeta souniana TaxID=164452 RepID=UPI000AB9CCF6|nr:hypothetical protein [Vulcanisaeta souniana]